MSSLLRAGALAKLGKDAAARRALQPFPAGAAGLDRRQGRARITLQRQEDEERWLGALALAGLELE